MKLQDFYNEERALYEDKSAEQDSKIRQLLEPKHTPETSIKFAPRKSKRNPLLRHITHFSAVAAALVIGLFIGVSINNITASENEKIIYEAVSKYESVETFVSEGTTRIKIFTQGPMTNPNFQNLDDEVRYTNKVLIKDGKTYCRCEYKDKNSTVDILDGEYLTTWQNGVPVQKISVGAVNFPMLSMLSLGDALSFVKNTFQISAAVRERDNKIVLSYKSKNSDRYIAHTFSKEDKRLSSSQFYKIVDDKIVILQSMEKFICNQPLSVEEITTPPTK